MVTAALWRDASPKAVNVKCPRCGHELVHHEPNAKWRRYFECEECFVTWRIFMGRLEVGRTAAGELSDFPDSRLSIKEMAEEVASELEFRNREGIRRAMEASA